MGMQLVISYALLGEIGAPKLNFGTPLRRRGQSSDNSFTEMAV